MRFKLARFTRLFQAACPVLVILGAALLVFLLRDEAKDYPGPPFYLPFVFLAILAGGVLSIATLFLWVWKPLGWCLCVLSDIGISLWAAWIVIADVIGKKAAFAIDAPFMAVLIWFGTIAGLFFSGQSLEFFQVTESSQVEATLAS